MAMVNRGMLDSSRNIVLACALSALAGYVDGIGYLHLGGLFVSFMSGNSTRMGVSLADGQFRAAGEAFGLIALFVLGAAVGSLIVLGRAAAELGVARGSMLLVAAGACHRKGFAISRLSRSCWRWGWRMRCFRSAAVRASD